MSSSGCAPEGSHARSASTEKWWICSGRTATKRAPFDSRFSGISWRAPTTSRCCAATRSDISTRKRAIRGTTMCASSTPTSSPPPISGGVESPGLNFSHYRRAVSHHEPRRRHVAGDRARGTQIDLLYGFHVAGHFAADDDGLREQVRLDCRIAADRQAVAAELNRSFDVTVDRQIFGADDFAFDADGFSDPGDH